MQLLLNFFEKFCEPPPAGCRNAAQLYLSSRWQAGGLARHPYSPSTSEIRNLKSKTRNLFPNAFKNFSRLFKSNLGIAKTC